MIASRKQPWATRKYLTRRQVDLIHATHTAAFWVSIFAAFCSLAVFLLWGVPASQAMLCAVALLAFMAAISGTFTDMMSMRIPDQLTATVLVSAAGWWALEYSTGGIAEGDGMARDVMGLILPRQGAGSAVPNFDSAFWGAWFLLDILVGILVFYPLYFSFRKGLGLGGGDVKLMTALAFFFGWPLGFDFAILTYFFGGFMSLGIIVARVASKVSLRAGLRHPLLKHLAGVRTFAYAPAITLAALICFAEKTEGLLK